MTSSNFFGELKRRNVIRFAGLYLVGAWLLTQVASTVFPAFEVPGWALRALIITLVLGFVPAVIFSWVFELTPQGLKRDEDVAPEQSIAPQTGRRMDRVIIAVLVFALAYFCVDKFVLSARREVVVVAPPGKPLPPPPPTEANAKSIAVLPFDNLSSDQENAFFAEGVQDEILTRLAKVADLKVISRTSTQRFKSAPGDLKQIAQQLGVMNILEGSVQKSNNAVRVNVQLINAMSDAHLWADSYDRKLTDMFAVESDIAKSVADMLQAKLTGTELQLMSMRPTEDPVAHELLVKGRYFLGLRRDDNLARAIGFFEQVIARDPNYAAAYGGLSEAYIVLPRYTAASGKEAFPKAKAAALKALELSPNIAEAHNALGKLAYDADLDFAESAREFERAIALNPNYAGAHHWYSGGPLEALGKFDQAIAEGSRGVELDPLSVVNLVDLGRIYFSARRFAEATAMFEKALQLDPTFSYAHWHFGEMLQVKGDLQRAAAEYAHAAEEKGDPIPIALVAQLNAKMGRPEDARKALQELAEISKERPVDAYWVALLHLSLNEKDEALTALEECYDDRSGYNIGPIKVDPMLDALRGDPRFEALVEKVTGPKTAGTR